MSDPLKDKRKTEFEARVARAHANGPPRPRGVRQINYVQDAWDQMRADGSLVEPDWAALRHPDLTTADGEPLMSSSPPEVPEGYVYRRERSLTPPRYGMSTINEEEFSSPYLPGQTPEHKKYRPTASPSPSPPLPPPPPPPVAYTRVRLRPQLMRRQTSASSATATVDSGMSFEERRSRMWSEVPPSSPPTPGTYAEECQVFKKPAGDDFPIDIDIPIRRILFPKNDNRKGFQPKPAKPVDPTVSNHLQPAAEFTSFSTFQTAQEKREARLWQQALRAVKEQEEAEEKARKKREEEEKRRRGVGIRQLSVEEFYGKRKPVSRIGELVKREMGLPCGLPHSAPVHPLVLAQKGISADGPSGTSVRSAAAHEAEVLTKLLDGENVIPTCAEKPRNWRDSPLWAHQFGKPSNYQIRIPATDLTRAQLDHIPAQEVTVMMARFQAPLRFTRSSAHLASLGQDEESTAPVQAIALAEEARRKHEELVREKEREKEEREVPATQPAPQEPLFFPPPEEDGNKKKGREGQRKVHFRPSQVPLTQTEPVPVEENGAGEDEDEDMVIPCTQEEVPSETLATTAESTEAMESGQNEVEVQKSVEEQVVEIDEAFRKLHEEKADEERKKEMQRVRAEFKAIEAEIPRPSLPGRTASAWENAEPGQTPILEIGGPVLERAPVKEAEKHGDDDIEDAPEPVKMQKTRVSLNALPNDAIEDASQPPPKSKSPEKTVITIPDDDIVDDGPLQRAPAVNEEVETEEIEDAGPLPEPLRWPTLATLAIIRESPHRNTASEDPAAEDEDAGPVGVEDDTPVYRSGMNPYNDFAEYAGIIGGEPAYNGYNQVVEDSMDGRPISEEEMEHLQDHPDFVVTPGDAHAHDEQTQSFSQYNPDIDGPLITEEEDLALRCGDGKSQEYHAEYDFEPKGTPQTEVASDEEMVDAEPSVDEGAESSYVTAESGAFADQNIVPEESVKPSQQPAQDLWENGGSLLRKKGSAGREVPHSVAPRAPTGPVEAPAVVEQEVVQSAEPVEEAIAMLAEKSIGEEAQNVEDVIPTQPESSQKRKKKNKKDKRTSDQVEVDANVAQLAEPETTAAGQAEPVRAFLPAVLEEKVVQAAEPFDEVVEALSDNAVWGQVRSALKESSPTQQDPFSTQAESSQKRKKNSEKGRRQNAEVPDIAQPVEPEAAVAPVDESAPTLSQTVSQCKNEKKKSKDTMQVEADTAAPVAVSEPAVVETDFAKAASPDVPMEDAGNKEKQQLQPPEVSASQSKSSSQIKKNSKNENLAQSSPEASAAIQDVANNDSTETAIDGLSAAKEDMDDEPTCAQRPIESVQDELTTQPKPSQKKKKKSKKLNAKSPAKEAEDVQTAHAADVPGPSQKPVEVETSNGDATRVAPSSADQKAKKKQSKKTKIEAANSDTASVPAPAVSEAPSTTVASAPGAKLQEQDATEQKTASADASQKKRKSKKAKTHQESPSEEKAASPAPAAEVKPAQPEAKPAVAEVKRDKKRKTKKASGDSVAPPAATASEPAKAQALDESRQQEDAKIEQAEAAVAGMDDPFVASQVAPESARNEYSLPNAPLPFSKKRKASSADSSSSEAASTEKAPSAVADTKPPQDKKEQKESAEPPKKKRKPVQEKTPLEVAIAKAKKLDKEDKAQDKIAAKLGVGTLATAQWRQELWKIGRCPHIVKGELKAAKIEVQRLREEALSAKKAERKTSGSGVSVSKPTSKLSASSGPPSTSSKAKPGRDVVKTEAPKSSKGEKRKRETVEAQSAPTREEEEPSSKKQKSQSKSPVKPPAQLDEEAEKEKEKEKKAKLAEKRKRIKAQKEQQKKSPVKEQQKPKSPVKKPSGAEAKKMKKAKRKSLEQVPEAKK
ncbi:hypothetical protein YB2330_006658 [Saitoella coloradoensis]